MKRVEKSTNQYQKNIEKIKGNNPKGRLYAQTFTAKNCMEYKKVNKDYKKGDL